MMNFDREAGDELAFKQAAMIAAMPRNLGTRAALDVACKTQTHTTDLLLVILDKAGLLRMGAQPFGRDKSANLQLESAVEAWLECLSRPDGEGVVVPPAATVPVMAPAPAKGVNAGRERFNLVAEQAHGSLRLRA